MNLSNITSFLKDGDVLLVVPPFACIDKPSLGMHVLQACAQQDGFTVNILYANLCYAQLIGEKLYQFIAYNTNPTFVGEKIFYRAAYGNAPCRCNDNKDDINFFLKKKLSEIDDEIVLPSMIELQEKAEYWADCLSGAICQKNIMVVGCTSTFEQTAASLALFNRIKHIRPDIITIMGGANCQGVMARGILSLSKHIDFVFTGEGEIAFPKFLHDVANKQLPQEPVISCENCSNLDVIPTINYKDFYQQFKSSFLHSESIIKEIWLSYETSRGCWYGEKKQCRFCGINGQSIKFRQKTAHRAVSELKYLLQFHPNQKVCMSDCNMPYDYFKTFLPILPEQLPKIEIFYELKANLTYSNMELLKKAGVVAIQPGIESLSTHCLKLMNKGVSARQNVTLLRYARIFDISVSWNILYAIPNDRIVEYQQIYDLLPLLSHFQPPLGITPICIERFSPYFTHPKEFGLSNIRPVGEYAHIMPSSIDIESIAYHFHADYKSESLNESEFMKKIKKMVLQWKNQWVQKQVPPTLSLTALSKDSYLMIDTRELPGTQELNIISESQAEVALTGKSTHSNDDVEWGIRQKVITEIDSINVPLCTSHPELLQRFGVS